MPHSSLLSASTVVYLVKVEIFVFSTNNKGLKKYGKMPMAQSIGFEATDFSLPSFMFEKMTGSADDFYRHSMTKVAVNAVEDPNMRSAALRYCVQIHTSLMSTLTERSFYQNLFATNMPTTGRIKMPAFGRELLIVRV